MIICKQCGHPNAEGTTFCKNSDCGAFLEWTGERVRTETIPAIDLEGRKGKGAVTAAISEADLTADPGGEVTVEVRVANRGRVVDQVTVYVSGEPGRWATVRPDRINLLPDTEDVARITFALPQSGVTAGPRPFFIEAVSREDPEARATADGTLTVRSRHELAAKLTPRTVESRRRATYQVVLENLGNTPVRARLTAEDERAALSFTFHAPEVALGPGEERATALEVMTRHQPAGAPQMHRFRVQIEPDAGSPIQLDGELTDLPAPARVTKGRLLALRVLLTLLGALLMVGGTQMSWLEGISGVDLTYDQYANAVFDANADEPPDGLPTIAASVALPAIVFALLAVLGLLGSKARLTKAAAVLSLLGFVAFAITLGQAGFSVGAGVIVVVIGSIVALVGGLMANAARAKT